MKELTEIEKQYAAAMLSCTGTSSGINQSAPGYWSAIRESMRRTAYHEAGHFAARLFTRLELSHVLAISIIGNEKFAGYVRAERNFTESNLESEPPPLQRSRGRMLLLENLAGSGAEIMLDQPEEWESIFAYLEVEWNDEEGTDLSRALRIAKIMAKPFMPVGRILKLADKWTLEMLSIPTVWNVVETVAGKLIKHGEIMNEELYAMADDSNFPTIYHLSEWRRRIWFKPGELEKYIEHA
jgi:hypothetical protein